MIEVCPPLLTFLLRNLPVNPLPASPYPACPHVVSSSHCLILIGFFGDCVAVVDHRLVNEVVFVGGIIIRHPSLWYTAIMA